MTVSWIHSRCACTYFTTAPRISCSTFASIRVVFGCSTDSPIQTRVVVAWTDCGGKKRQQHSIKYLHTFVAMDELFNINSSSNLLLEQQWHTFDDWWFLLRPNKQDLVAPKMQLLYIFLTLYLKNGVLNEFKVQKCLLVFIWHTVKLATFYSLPQLAQDPL